MLEYSDAEVMTGNETNEVLNYLSKELIEENLKKQILEIETGYNHVDYIEVIKSRFEFLYKSFENNEEIIQQLDLLKDEFFKKILLLIQEKFSFEITFNSLLLKEEKYFVIEELYQFFILNISTNISIFYKNFILRESEGHLAETCKNDVNTKDMYYQLFRKTLNKDNSTIMYCLKSIIDNHHIEFIEDFIEDVVCDDENEEINYIMASLFIRQEFVSNVKCSINEFNNTIKNILNNDSLIMKTINSDIYKSFLNKQSKENNE